MTNRRIVVVFHRLLSLILMTEPLTPNPRPIMTPQTTSPLTVTSLEDRCLATTLIAPQVVVPATLVAGPAQVSQFTPPSAWAVPVGTGAIGIMGLRVNHNETFVRRRR